VVQLTVTSFGSPSLAHVTRPGDTEALVSDHADASDFRIGHEVGVGEVETVNFVELDGSQQEVAVEDRDGVAGEDDPRYLGDPVVLRCKNISFPMAPRGF
jgi:hypothetical protein